MVLYAGPLQMLYENGFVRYIKYNDTEVLRMIYFALRDEHWETCEHVIINEEKHISWETFQIIYKSVSRCLGRDIIEWNCMIDGSPDGTIRFTIDGLVKKDFKKNRAGFCVLHPLSIVGTQADIDHTNGTRELLQFPITVAAENPFQDIRAMRWKAGEHNFEVSFEGDIFETEDQRNWIDASFKTFCTPAALPIPVTIVEGEKISQRIILRALDKLPSIAIQERSIISLEATGKNLRFPEIGTALNHESISEDAIRELGNINLDFLQLHVKPSDEGWVSHLSQNLAIAGRLRLRADIKLYLSDNYPSELEHFITLLKQNRVNIGNITLLKNGEGVTPKRILAYATELRSAFANVKIGAGTDSHFKEINRNAVQADLIDFIAFAAYPQVHLTDDRTIIENIEGIRQTGIAARKKYGAKEVYVSPLTIAKRDSAAPDHRHQNEFAALWVLGCLRSATEGNVKWLSLFEVVGKNGMISENNKSYPLVETLKTLLTYKHHQVIELENSDPLSVDALLASNEHSTALFLVNYTDDVQTVKYAKKEIQVLPRQMMQVNLSST